MEQKLVAISRFDGSVSLLKIDLLIGTKEIIPIHNVELDKISFGFYEQEKGAPPSDSIALLATPEGPLLFLDDLEYRP